MKAMLGGLPFGAIVCVGERWGVVCRRSPTLRHLVVVDFWEGGREHVPDKLQVRWMPGTGGGPW